MLAPLRVQQSWGGGAVLWPVWLPCEPPGCFVFLLAPSQIQMPCTAPTIRCEGAIKKLERGCLGGVKELYWGLEEIFLPTCQRVP